MQEGKRHARAGYRWLRPPERLAVEQRLREGAPVKEITEEFDCSVSTVWRIRDATRLRRRRAHRSRLRLSFEERERISRGLAAGESARAIARELARAPSTISREIERAGGRRRYRGAGGRAWRPQTRHPAQGGQALALPAPGGRGRSRACQALVPATDIGQTEARAPRRSGDADQPRDDLPIALRPVARRASPPARPQPAARPPCSPHAHRGPQRRGRIPGMVPIAARPPEVDERRVPGHWEGGLLAGWAGRSFIATLVERRTRYVMLARLGGERASAHVVAALAERIARLPRHLALSLTWDQGKELTRHARFSVQTGVAVYFCDPHSPWQRGSNENTNGLLRQYLPKGTDLAARSQVELDVIAAELNGRPRRTLGWATPAEKMEELLR